MYDCIYPFTKGGAERRFYEIGKRLATMGYEVHWYGMKFWDGPSTLVHEGMTLHGLCKARPLYTYTGRRSIFQAIVFGLSTFRIIGKQFDAIDCCGFPYFSLFPCKLAAIIRRRRLVATWHEVWGLQYWKSYLGRLGNIGYAIERLASKLPDLFITDGYRVERQLKDVLHVSQPIQTIRSGIDLSLIDRISKANANSDIIYVGRLVQHKNVDQIIRALRLIKDAGQELHCVVIGDGPEKQSLEEISKELHVDQQISWLGFVEDSENVYAHMKASRVFVLPSSREGFGIVAVEANACGLPVVTVQEPGNAVQDLLEGGKNGSAVPNTPAFIASAILDWLGKDGSSTRSLVSDFDWVAICEEAKRAYGLK